MLVLDDVISAVDAGTARHIVQHCLTGRLVEGRTIIIASHAVESLAIHANQAIFLEHGKAVWTGTGPDLLQTTHMDHLKTETSSQDLDSQAEMGGVPDSSGHIKHKHDLVLKEQVHLTPKQLIIEEKRNKGNVDVQHWTDLKQFMGGNVYWIGAIAFLLIALLAPIAERHVLKYEIDCPPLLIAEHGPTSHISSPQHSGSSYTPW